ncbi:FAD dependent oxidoreductase [Aspergillus avenaceus]|uniref:FAD dependent oxidoreductase n=1 Tax=Aspergillus avenaceus TaxID=36643 RepID=A0A5N6TXV7_ASPAV|nr:FAD dependent oxidoreductase [Aspergillus avenaceus]
MMTAVFDVPGLGPVAPSSSSPASFDVPSRVRVLLLGGGVSSLMTAWMLLDKGYMVTIVSRDWASQTRPITSQVAGALWEYPPGGCGIAELGSSASGYSGLDQYREWALQSFEFYEAMAALDEAKGDKEGRFGVKMKKLVQFFGAPLELGADDDRHREKYCAIRRMDEDVDSPFYGRLGMRDVSGEELTRVDPTGVFGVTCAYEHVAPVIDTDAVMRFLMELVQRKGAVLKTREIEGDIRLQEQMLLSEYRADVIVNATGIGARQLANDSQMFPVRGAVRRIKRPPGYPADKAFLLPAQTASDGSVGKTVFIVPRNDETVVVGSIVQRDNWKLNLSLDSSEVRDMWERATEFLPILKEAEPADRPLVQGLRPFSHLNVRVAVDGPGSRIVHNYGHGGSGWTLAVGCARTCVRLVDEILHRDRLATVDMCRL